MNTVMDELLDEMADEDNEKLEEWFGMCGDFMKWIGTGDADDMPAMMREKFAIEAPPPAESASEEITGKIVEYPVILSQ